MPAEIADVLGTNAAGVTKAEQLTDGDFTSDFSIFVTPKEQIRNGGSCSFQYRVNGQNQSAANAARGSGGGSIETENKALGLAMTKSLEVKESIVSAFEFLQLFNHGKPDSDTTLMADDVFGIHKTLRSALLRISKSRYQAFMDQKNLDKELGEEVLALQAMNDPALYQRLMREGSDNVKTLIANLEAKRGTAEGADFQKSMMVFQIRSAEKMAEISANRKRDLQDSFVELMDNYEKDEKDLDRSDAGGSNPKKFTLFTWLKDNRRAGETATSRPWTYLTDTNQNNDGISHDDAGDKKQWAPQEEVNEGGWDAEEGEEGRESCNIQTGVIFRTSTRCKYTHLQEEVTEAVGEYETEESFNWEMSRYCIGKGAGHDSKAGKGFSKALNLTSYPFFQRNQLKEVMKELDYDWLENELDLKMTYITTYPALLYNKDGVEQAEANLSRNIRENFRAYIEDPVKYTRGFDAIRGQAAAGTNFFGTSYKEALSQLAADDFDMLEHIVYLTSASYTRMQPAEYRASVILFLGRIVEDLARVYGELESGFIQQKDCYQGVLDQLGGSGPGNNRNRPTIGFGAPGAGSVAAPLGVVDVTGAGNGGSGSGVGFGNGGSGIGFGGFQGGVGLSAGGSFNTLADQKRQENFNRLSTDMNNIFSSFAKRKERFNKNFKGMAIARRQNALGGMLRKGVKSIIEDARKANQLASAKLRGQGTSSGSSLNGLINGSANNSGSGSGSGTADNSDAERLKRLRDNMNGEGGGGNRGGGGGGGGLFGGGDSGGSNGGNSFAGRSGGGTEDTHGLIDAAKRDRGELENKEDDSIFKIITNRYMKSLDKILIRKK